MLHDPRHKRRSAVVRWLRERGLRLLFWLAGALVITSLYTGLLILAAVDVPDDASHKLLLTLSGIAACMVGGEGAVLLFDSMKRRRRG